MGIDPITATLFAFQAFSAVKGYQQDEAAADAQRAANQQITAANKAAMQAAQEEARLTREDAALTAEQERKEARRVRGQQIAAFLKSGVTLEGSPLLVLDETTQEGERNAQNTLRNADSQAKSLILRGKASQQPINTNIQGGDIFGTGASILGSGINAGRGGAFGSKAKTYLEG